MFKESNEEKSNNERKYCLHNWTDKNSKKINANYTKEPKEYSRPEK